MPPSDVAPGYFADGIYFGLEEAPYHADPALGSTDLKKLAAEPAAYWFGSALNPNRADDDEDAPHRIVGRAVHKFVLEGPQAFNGRFERAPEGSDLLRTNDDLGQWLKETTKLHAERMKAIALSSAVASTKAARISQIRDLCTLLQLDLPRIPEVIESDAAAAGRTLLKGEIFDRIIQAGGAVLDNPHLAGSFHGGQPEVSVFWTETVEGEPVRRKARFDYLKPRAVVDLKSTRPMDGIPFVASCRKALGQWNYPTQAAAYLQGRAKVSELVADGQVFGDHDPAWLARVAAADAFAFVFVFWSSVGAPLTWGGILSPGSPVLDVGEEYVRRGLEAYVTARREHGTVAPWITHQPLKEIELDHLPRWWGAA